MAMAIPAAVEVKVATWSPDGQLLAFVDPNEGVGVRSPSRLEDAQKFIGQRRGWAMYLHMDIALYISSIYPCIYIYNYIYILIYIYIYI